MTLPPPNIPCPPLPTASPLDEGHFRQIRQAALARKAVHAAARTARSSGISILTIGFLSLLVCLFSWSRLGLLVSLGACIVGVVELRGGRRMQHASPTAARMLGLNQLALLGLIIVYCVIQMAEFSTDTARDALVSREFAEQLKSLPHMQRSLDDMVHTWAPMITYGFYGLVILASVAMQGGMAWYYFSRRKHVETFVAQTPAWIQRLFLEANA